MIYFTSDLHFWHKNVIRYTDRPFSSVNEMNEKLIENWNHTVHANDEVYILGDVTMRKLSYAQEILLQLKGRKYLLVGNHDYFARKTAFDPASCDLQWVKMYHELHWQRNFVYVIIPFLSWNKSLHGSYNLHGHSHNHSDYNFLNREQDRRQYDVGVDANNYRPVSIEEIIRFFENKEE